MKPKLNLVHWPKGRYVNAASTDVAKTFARVRREMHRERVQQQGEPQPTVILFGSKR